MSVTDSNIPQEMRDLPRWILWKLTNVPGRLKPAKIPHSVDGKRADATNPTTWSTYTECLEKLATYDGLGFVFDPSDNIFGVDYDGVRDKDTGEIDPDIFEEVLSLNSYTEVSPSGTGLHVILRGTKPGAACRAGCREMYETGRYFTVTGNHLPGTPIAITSPTVDKIKVVYDKIVSEQATPKKTKSPAEVASGTENGKTKQRSPDLTDEEVISLLMGSRLATLFEELCDGNLSEYDNDASAADYHLCRLISFYTQKPDQIERIARRSKLARDKWDRPDYVERTISSAIDSLGSVYTGDGTKHDGKEISLDDIENPEVKEELEKARKAKEQFLQYKDLSPLEREIACNQVWKSYELDMRKAGKAYKEVFPEHKKDEETDTLEPVPAHIKERAREIAEKENPFEFILNTHQTLHVGDIGYATTLLLSCTNQSSLNSEGLQPKGSGASGKGKSHCTKAMTHLIPRDWILTASLSNKAIYYMQGRMKAGMLLNCDDVTLSEEMEGVIKRATTFYQTGDTYITMDKNREPMTLTIPARLVWWLNSVDDEQSIQLLNRTFGAEVDESTEQDDAVALRELELAEAGTAGMPETDDVLMCREIIRDIKENLYIVRIPFARDIIWKDKKNRRNLPIFLDLVRAFAILRHRQRERDQSGALMADMQDFADAKILYTSRQEAQGTKLTATERKLCEFLNRNGNEMSYHLLADVMKVGESRITQILMGRKDVPDSGLIYKVPGLHVEKRSEKNASNGYTSRNYVRMTAGYDPLSGFEEVVSIDRDSESYSAYSALTSNLHLKNRNGKHELTLLTITNTLESINVSQSSHVCGENGNNNILSHTEQKDCKNCKNLTADGENTTVSSCKETVSNCKKPSNPLLYDVRRYCRDWEPAKKTSINSQNYMEVVTDYLKGYKLPDNMREPVETAVMIYAKIPQPPEVTL